MNRPLVSIIIPSTNHGERLFESIDSVLSQDYSPIELLVAYGGCTDETVEWWAGRRGYDKRLNYFSLPGAGTIALVDHALRHVRGTIIGYLNPGNAYERGVIARAVEAFAVTPDWLMIYGNGEIIDAAENVVDCYPALRPDMAAGRLSDDRLIALPAIFFKLSLTVLLGAGNEQHFSPFRQDFWRMAFMRYADRMGYVDAVRVRSRKDGKEHREAESALLSDYPQDNCLVPSWEGRVFSQAISFGCCCHAAKVLRDIEYRAFSGPFDWIFSSPKIVTHMLQDDFGLFLDVSQYQPVPVEQRINVEANLCDHRFYRDQFGMRFLFNHHSPDNAEDHAHFVRAVRRFREAMANSQPLLLLMVVNQIVQLDDYWPLLDALDRYSSDYALLLLRFRVDEAVVVHGERREPRLLYHDRRFAALEMSFHGRSNGVEFADDEDNQALIRVLRRFNVQSHPRRWFREGLTADNFDEAGYLRRNPDVLAAINAGNFSSGWQHFQQYGFQEGRR